jgi:hypothetical protein
MLSCSAREGWSGGEEIASLCAQCAEICLAQRLPELHIQVQLQQMHAGELNQAEQHMQHEFQRLHEQQPHIEIDILPDVGGDEPRSLWQDLEW